VNPWLLLITTKPPKWRDPLMVWKDSPPTFGVPHEGFYYPDPQGFWTEVRRWVTVLVRLVEPRASTAEALAVATLLHVGDNSERAAWAVDRLGPEVTLFLDEASWAAAAIDTESTNFAIPDPHRAGVEYEGRWARSVSGKAVGKAPQHPAAHQLYRAADMDAFLRAMPIG
jgi:hypothetical protein